MEICQEGQKRDLVLWVKNSIMVLIHKSGLSFSMGYFDDFLSTDSIQENPLFPSPDKGLWKTPGKLSIDK